MPIIPYIGVVFPFIGSRSYLFLDDFEGHANNSIAIKSSSAVVEVRKFSPLISSTIHQTNVSGFATSGVNYLQHQTVIPTVQLL